VVIGAENDSSDVSESESVSDTLDDDLAGAVRDEFRFGWSSWSPKVGWDCLSTASPSGGLESR
jgi:hypothetical protein